MENISDNKKLLSLADKGMERLTCWNLKLDSDEAKYKVLIVSSGNHCNILARKVVDL